jgi:hypothetical protein
MVGHNRSLRHDHQRSIVHPLLLSRKQSYTSHTQRGVLVVTRLHKVVPKEVFNADLLTQ